jgi:hypothetical protein
MPMDGRARPGQLDSQRMASGAGGGGWTGTGYQVGSQYSMFVSVLFLLRSAGLFSDPPSSSRCLQERPLDVLAAQLALAGKDAVLAARGLDA